MVNSWGSKLVIWGPKSVQIVPINHKNLIWKTWSIPKTKPTKLEIYLEILGGETIYDHQCLFVSSLFQYYQLWFCFPITTWLLKVRNKKNVLVSTIITQNSLTITLLGLLDSNLFDTSNNAEIKFDELPAEFFNSLRIIIEFMTFSHFLQKFETTNPSLNVWNKKVIC